jgi:hypothetical protein
MKKGMVIMDANIIKAIIIVIILAGGLILIGYLMCYLWKEQILEWKEQFKEGNYDND